MKKIIRIATRKSPLALWQAMFVKKKLLELSSNIQVDLLPLVTKGDIHLETSLSKVGGKGLFIKELELALLSCQADIAVHSMKDMTVHLPDGLIIAACLEREDPRDALVSNTQMTIDTLPIGAKIGTSSLRRQSQLLARRSDLTIKLLRGNVGTRLSQLAKNQFDGIILAAAGLHRLALKEKISEYLSPAWCLPAVGQGIIGVQSRANDEDLNQLLFQLNHPPTAQCLIAERAMNTLLGGACHVPIAGYATIEKDEIYLQGRVITPDGQLLLKAEATGKEPLSVGTEVGRALLAQGAEAIIDSIYHD
jgi:hydroxymethylbilane synthase